MVARAAHQRRIACDVADGGIELRERDGQQAAHSIADRHADADCGARPDGRLGPRSGACGPGGAVQGRRGADRRRVKAESFLDTDTLRPSLATVYSDERGRTRLRTMRFLPGDMVELEVKTAAVARSSVKVQPQSYDALSAVYALRATPLRQGQTVALPLVNNGRMYRLRAYVAARERLDTAIGRQLPALRLALSLADDQGRPATTRDLTLWLSDDARRLPLRVEVGLAVGNFALALSRAS
ncbi:MAG: DUF3108 domain-containing protein [Acidobacteria bacterium]|nr:DUF3108 domain-containing protein [Acidobacteriota bacterium]